MSRSLAFARPSMGRLNLSLICLSTNILNDIIVRTSCKAYSIWTVSPMGLCLGRVVLCAWPKL